MSTPSLEDVLAQHRPTIASGGFTDCRCGKNLDEKGSWAAHAAEVIREHWELTPITATSRVARMIFECLPEEPGAEPMPPWDELTDEQRKPWIVNARNLAHVYPERYPDIVSEMRGES